jgi:hypothetical protein
MQTVRNRGQGWYFCEDHFVDVLMDDPFTTVQWQPTEVSISLSYMERTTARKGLQVMLSTGIVEQKIRGGSMTSSY